MNYIETKIRHLWNILFRYLYPVFKCFQTILTVVSPLIVALFLVIAGYLVFTGSDQFTDLLVAMLNDWRFKSLFKHTDTGNASYYGILIRDGSFLIALCIWSFSLAFASRWVLLRSQIRAVPLRPEFSYLQHPLERFQDRMLRYAPRMLAFLPFAMVAWAFYRTSTLLHYQPSIDCYWILVLVVLGVVISGGVLTLIHNQVAYGKMRAVATDQSDYSRAITSRTAHAINEFPLFQKWVIALAVLNLTLTFFLGFFHRLVEWLQGGDSPIEFDLATRVGFGTIFICALAGWGFLLMWLRLELRRRTIPLLGVLVVFAWVVYTLGINIVRREIRTQKMKTTRPTDAGYVDAWLLSRQKEAVDTIPVFIVAAEGGGSRSAHWTAGVLARLDAELPGFRQNLLAISGVSGGSVGAGYYVSWLYDHPEQKSIRLAVDSLTSADFLSGLVGAFCYPDPLLSLIPWAASSPKFDRARWLEERFSDHYFYKTGRNTLTQGFSELAQQHPEVPLLLLNSTVVETGKKAIISPIRLDSTFFYGSRDVLTELERDVPLMTALGLSARFPVVTPAGTVYGPDKKISYRLADGGYFENTGMQTAYQLLQLVMCRRSVLSRSDPENPKGRLNGRIVKPIIVFIENGDSRTADTLQAQTGFAPLSAFYKAWDNRTPSIIGDMKYFISQSMSPDGFQLFRLKRSDEEIIPLGWYLSEVARQAINEQIDGIGNDTSYRNIQRALVRFNPPVQKSIAPEKRIDAKILSY